jgi:RNA polymerase sigma-70 factor (ECF subfamily)
VSSRQSTVNDDLAPKDPHVTAGASTAGDALVSAVGPIGPAVVSQPGRQAAAYEVAELYDGHQRELFSFALAATRDAEEASDVVQESFLKLVREINAGRPPSNPRPWLYRVAANQAISRARRVSVAARWKTVLESRHKRDSPGPETEYLAGEASRGMHAALAELSADERTGLILAAQGFSGAEIAISIGRSQAATRTLMCRARAKLRVRLIDERDGAQ